MPRSKSNVMQLTIRVPAKVSRRLAREARKRRTTRSDVAPTILESALVGDADLTKDARRQSRLVSRRRSERDALAFVTSVADGSGWR